MKILNKKAISVIEYSVLIIIIIGAFVLMKNHIQRGVYSKWAQSGQSFGFGRQYDPQKTIECGFDEQSNLWYDRNCFESLKNQNCAIGDAVCEEAQMISCNVASCNQMNQPP